MMRVAYIYLILAENIVGLEKKIHQQAHVSPREFDFYFLNRFIHKDYGRLKFIKIKSSGIYYEYIFNKFALIEKNVDLSRYELVLLRYPIADRSSLKFAEKYNVISEHHADSLPELKSNLIGPSSLQRKIASLLRLYTEYQYGKAYRQRCKWIVAVTDELRQRQLDGIDTKVPSCTISNGIDVDSVKKTGFIKLDGKYIDLIFVASHNSAWHGLNRLIDSIDLYHGDYSIKLHVIGDIKPQEITGNRRDDVIFYGENNGPKLEKLFYKKHLAVSTLGLYLKNLNQAAPLKTREYTARGIPFILAYNDVDLKAVDDQNRFYLQFENTGSPILMDKIIRFIEEINNRYKDPSQLSDYMRQYALENMDWKIKMKRYLESCEQVMENIE